MSRYHTHVKDAEQWAAYQQRRDEQLGVVNRESLEQLQIAVDQAAAGGDPIAGQMKAATGHALLRNLTLHFTNRAAELKS
jgi:hypothetical protein